MNNILMIFVGGGLGSLARYGISVFVKSNFQFVFPLATLLSNIISCVVLAIVVGIFSEKVLTNNSLAALIVIGFCGGFSTFSTFSFETVELFRNGNNSFAIANILISITACLGIIFFLTKSNPV